MSRPDVGNGLDEDKRALLLRLARGQSQPHRADVRGQDGAPLAFVQQKLWLIHKLQPDTTAYNESFALEFRGRLDVARLERALAMLADRQEILRTAFVERAGEPWQVAAPTVEIRLPEEDLRGAGEPAGEALSRVAARMEAQPFDFARPPLFRACVCRLDGDRDVVLFVFHHMIADTWSMPVLMRELSECYRAQVEGRSAELAQLPLQYGEFAAQQRIQGDDVFDAKLESWKARFGGDTPVFDPPLDHPRPAEPSGRGASATFRLAEPASRALAALGGELQVTPFMLLLAGLLAWIHKFTGQDDIVIGCPIANRTRRDVEGLIGFFANTVVVRGRIDAVTTYRSLVEQVREHVLDVFDHQDVPFDRLVDVLGVRRDLSRNPLFQVMFNYENAFTAQKGGEDRLLFRPIGLKRQGAKFDLSLYMIEAGGRIEGLLQYSLDLFTPETGEAMAASLAAWLGELAERSDRPLATLSLAGGVADADGAAAALAFGGPDLLHEMIEAQASKTPDAPAIRFEDEVLSYAELMEASRRAAEGLRARGSGPDRVIAVVMDRSLTLIPVLLGVLRSGAAYLPISPDDPPALIAAMLASAKPLLAVCAAGAPPAPEALDGLPLHLAEDLLSADQNAVSQAKVQADNLAYVLFTSGSTGRPKGCMVTHRAIANRLKWMQEAYPIGPGDVVLQKTPTTFDVSVWELFWPLTAGASVVVARPNGHRDPAYLREVVERAGVSVMHFVPTMLRLFLEAGSTVPGNRLRHVICSGEALDRAEARRFAQDFPNAALHNLYGPTEAAVDVTAWPVDADYPGPSLPIGQAIANVRIFILDEAMRPAPVGVEGELYIGGVAVGRGYCGAPGLTAASFTPSPFSPGERLYRTGDRARWLRDGQIEYRGRRDGQIKLRGYRIELGQVEAALRAHPAVSDAAVTTWGEGDDRRLAGYFVAEAVDDPAALQASLAAHLAAALPVQMIPADLIGLDRLPLNRSGKIDRARLPQPQLRSAAAGRAPVTPVETALAAAWCEVLRLDGVTVDENFFSLGGDSIRAIRVAAAAVRAGVAISVQDLFRNQTIAELAQVATLAEPVVEEVAAVGDDDPCGLDAAVLERLRALYPDAEDFLPLAPNPRDMLAQMVSMRRPEANLVQTMSLVPDIDVAAMNRAYALLAASNPVLRSSYHWEDLAEPVQVIHAAGSVPARYEDWRGLSPEAQRRRAAEVLQSDAMAGPALKEPAAWRVFYGRTSEDACLVLQSFNYICLDGWSMLLLGNEFQRLYRDFKSGQERAVQVRPAYRNYHAWLHRQRERPGTLAAAERFWREELDGHAPSLLAQALGEPRDLPEARFESTGLDLPAALTDGGRRFARDHRSTENLFYLTCWVLVLQHFLGRDDVVVGLVVTGRSPKAPDIEEMVGFTMNYQPLRMRVDRSASVREVLDQVAAKCADLLEYDTVSMQEVRRWTGYRDDEHMFDALYYFQNIGGYFRDGHSQVVDRRRPLAVSRTAYPLRLDIYPTVADIGNQIIAGYESGVFSRQGMTRLLRAYVEIIKIAQADPSISVEALLGAVKAADAGHWSVEVDVKTDTVTF